MWELLSHRVLWSVVLLGGLLLLLGQRVPWGALRGDPRQLGLVLLAGPVMSISWCMFTWCLTTGQVLATSLAFFMTPLFNIAFAVLFLKEGAICAGATSEDLDLLCGDAAAGFTLLVFGRELMPSADRSPRLYLKSREIPVIRRVLRHLQ